jgi:hypothetical protein
MGENNDPSDLGRAANDRAISTPDAAQPATYKVVCISIYAEDLEQLDGYVAELKSRGIRRANRSWLIRVALDRLDVKGVTNKDRP